jgi:ABC-type nickel/cobalt efflux system permease component RcnA
MTNVVIFIFVMLIVMALLLYAVELIPLPPAPPYLKRLSQALVVVFAALLILSRVTGCCVAW